MVPPREMVPCTLLKKIFFLNALAKSTRESTCGFLYAGSAIYIYEATTMAGSSCEDISISGGHDPRNCTWSDEVASDIRRYLERGQYPAHLPHSDTTKRRNFRKRAKDFVVHKDNLYYKRKKHELPAIVVASYIYIAEPAYRKTTRGFARACAFC